MQPPKPDHQLLTLPTQYTQREIASRMSIWRDNSVTWNLFDSSMNHVWLLVVHMDMTAIYDPKHILKEWPHFCIVADLLQRGGICVGKGDIGSVEWCWQEFNKHFLKGFWDCVVGTLKVLASMPDCKSSHTHVGKHGQLFFKGDIFWACDTEAAQHVD